MKAALQFAVDFWWLALVAVIAALLVSNAELRVDVADAKLEAATQLAARESAARVHETTLARKEKAHATAQQTKDELHVTEKKRLETELRSSAVDAGRMRTDLAAATARADAGAATDPVACQRAINRLDELGRLAGEGVVLLDEGRGLLKERDLDVWRLKDQVTLDRAACSPGG